ncbi:MAG: cation-translocating P-type ATPase [Sphaerochaetaceae bacterium]|nr:cation-translocating P-type ATPase [Sphaerochaetaceae bacterium]MDD4218793.1 cation-translocating P-type ATPase [Sphaerochaetaceae bacterium]
MKKFSKKTLVIIVSILIAISYILHKTIAYHPVTITIMLVSTIIAGGPILRRAISALRYKIVGIDALVSIAVIGALIIGEYWEAAAVTFLFMIGDYLESRTLEKTRSSIKSLMDLAPDTARVRIDGVEQILSPQELKQGMILVIKPGERIAADGIVLEGSAYVDQASITGEPVPVFKEKDAHIFSGTIITSGYLIVEATQVGESTTFAKILHLVEEAQDAKAPTQKFIERFSRYYTPAIIALSIITYLITRDIKMALTFLVIACPGALVISVPVSIVAAIGSSAKNGILVKGGEAIEKLSRVQAVAFDKTGTLTEGKPSVVSLHAYGMGQEDVLKIAVIGETYSEHPLATAILKEAANRGVTTTKVPENPEYIQGKGVSFSFEGTSYFIGNRTLFEENGIDLTAALQDIHKEEHEKRTVVIIGTTERVIGLIAIADKLREEAFAVIKELKKLRIKKSVMFTGDSKGTAETVAHDLQLDEFLYELLPEHKVEAVKGLQKKHGSVAFVGDGINDAPSLATANVGIAIGAAGNDVAMETADVVLLGQKLGGLIDAIRISHMAVRNMKQNIFFAIGVAVILLIGVLLGGVTLSIGMLVHEISVLLVIINATRILRFAKRKKYTSL